MKSKQRAISIFLTTISLSLFFHTCIANQIEIPENQNNTVKALEFRDSTPEVALKSLCVVSKINLFLPKPLKHELTINFSNISIENAINEILLKFNLNAFWDGNVLIVFQGNYPIQDLNNFSSTPISLDDEKNPIIKSIEFSDVDVIDIFQQIGAFVGIKTIQNKGFGSASFYFFDYRVQDLFNFLIKHFKLKATLKDNELRIE